VKLFTPPLSNYILDGITRKVILEICGREEIPVSETEIKTDDLKSFDEMMLLGTISEVMPVVKVDDWEVGNGKPGKVTLEIQYLLGEMIFS
jgi:D-alanine transaminase